MTDKTDKGGTDSGHVRNVSATDRLRALLDERGVEWMDGGEGSTVIPAQDGVPRAWNVNVWPSGKDMGDCLWVENRHPLTPEQAVAATLGAGTCEVAESADGYGWYCECGNFFPPSVPPRNYCPNCGRKVVG